MRVRFLATVPVLFAFAAVGCGQPLPTDTKPLPAKAPGRYTENLELNGVQRQFTWYVPKKYDATTPLPVVVLLHGWGGNANSIQTYTRFLDKAEKEGFFLVTPQGLGQTPGWNVDFLDLSGKKQDDVRFIERVLDRVEEQAGVDKDRIFVAGHSNGAMLAHLIGAKLSDRVAAIGSVAGTTGVPKAEGTGYNQIPEPKSPVSVILIHGMQDPLVAYAPTSTSLLRGIGVVEAGRWWAEKVGALLPPQKETLKDGKLVIDTYSGGKQGTEVVVVTIPEGKHEWPGQGQAPSPVVATDVLWDFFKTHPKKRAQ